MPNQVFRMVLFAYFLACPAFLPAADAPTSPKNLPADHTGEAADFLQTPAYKKLEAWYAKKAPALPQPKQPDDKIVEVKNIDEFLAACKAPEPNTTILLADGRYEVPDIVYIRHVKNLTIRSKSGNRAKVVLDGAKSKNERILWVEDCDGCTVADLTIQNALKYGLCFEANTSTQKVRVYNVHFHNIWQRGLKITGLIDPTKRQWAICDTFDDRTRKLRPHDGRVEYCLFSNDHRKQFDDGVDNGDYIAGMDAMWLKDWVISDNVFMNIEGWHVGGRGAIFVWVKSEDVTVERNVFLNCDRSISFGNPSGASEHMVHGVIRNNFIVCGANKGIELCRTRDCEVYNNTLYDPTADCSRVIHSFQPVGKVAIFNNLLRGTILVDAGEARVESNLLHPLDGWLREPGSGDLHLKWLAPELKNFAPSAVPNTVPAAGFDDFDAAVRPAAFLVGADQSSEALQPPDNIAPAVTMETRTPAAEAIRAEVSAACIVLANLPKPKLVCVLLTAKGVSLNARLGGTDADAGLKITVDGKPSTLAWAYLSNKDLGLVLEMLTDDGQKDAAAHYTALAKLYTYAKRPVKAADMVNRAIAKNKNLKATLPAEIAALE